MRTLTRRFGSMRHHAAGLLLGPLLTAGLLAANPMAANAATIADPDDTPSVNVTDVAKAGAASLQAATKNAPLPAPIWPKAGETTEVTIDDSFDKPDNDITARSTDPDGAPAAVSVVSLGKLTPTDDYGGGAVYTITPIAPATGESTDPAQPNDPVPSTPVPSDDPPTIAPNSAGAIFRPSTDPTADPTPTPTPTDEPNDPPADSEPADPYSAPIEVQIGYQDFAGAYGGDWASRLQAVQLSDCTTTDGHTACQSATPLESTNNTEDQTVTVTIPAETYGADAAPSDGTTPDATTSTQGSTHNALSTSSGSTQNVSTTGGTTTLALTAGPSGDQGSYSASPIGQNSEWSSGGQSGDFTWSYPITAPPGAGGPTPDLSLSYSSASVDGRTSSSNNQTSSIGEGFDLDPGFVERSYSPCSEDRGTGSNVPDDTDDHPINDLCWRNDNLTLSLNGKTTKIIHQPGVAGWRMESDDGTKIERKTGGANGDDDGEYWVVTTTDGTKYYYGVNERYDNDATPTDSVSTVPVFGNRSGDPCHASAFHDSRCRQGWRWGLDYVVDPHGNTMSLFYAQEENYYGYEGATGKAIYDRGSYLKRIEYGTTLAGDSATHPAAAPARVSFTNVARCIPTDIYDPDGYGCYLSDLPDSHASSFPDIPADQLCSSGSEVCGGRTSPTFFTEYRIDKITASTYNGSTYVPVNTYNLTQSFAHTGDGTDRSLWLQDIQQVGSEGPNQTVLPSVMFRGEQLQNRVDATGDGIAPFVKWRIQAIRNGMGGVTTVNYSHRDCSSSNEPNSGGYDHNTRLCYPVYYQRDFAHGHQIEMFHKYVVNSVVESDLTGGSPDVSTTYTYKGDPAWHFDESNLLQDKYRTWSDWRGYGEVITTVGGASAPTWNDTLYMRGMNTDPNDDGDNPSQKSVTVSDPNNVAGGPAYSPDIVDHSPYTGFVRRSLTTQGSPTAPVVDITVNTPGYVTTLDDGDGHYARMVHTIATQDRTPLAAGGERVTATATTYDSEGRPTSVFDDGDTTLTSDDQCTKTTYADNDDAWIHNAVASQITSVGACSHDPAGATDVISATQSFYDGHGGLSDAPTKGDVTTTKTASGWDDGRPAGDKITYQTDATNAYDGNGRVVSTKDALGKETKTEYVPAAGVPTQVTTTNALGQHTVQNLNKQWGTVDSSEDVAGHRTTVSYDGLGRTTSVKTPSSGTLAAAKYSYEPSSTVPNVVTTQKLNASGGYTTSKAFFDGLLRARETQTLSANSDGGRVVTEQRYNSLGQLESTRGPYYNSAPVDSTLVVAAPNQLPSYTNYEYDGAGRQTARVLMSYGKEKSRSSTTYGGDRTTLTPPTGGTKSTTVTDARGHTSSLLQYDAAGIADTTKYEYTPAGDLKKVTQMTDAGQPGTQWSYGYDIRGRQTSAIDPDKGATATTYDADDHPVSTTDAKGQTLWTTYDDLGRKTALLDGTSTAPDTDHPRATWTYDTAQTGQLTSSSRFVGGDEYKTSNTYDDAGRPLATTLMLPDSGSVGALYRSRGYTTTMTYNVDGSPKQVSQPSTAGTGVTNEPLNYTYDASGNVKTMTGAGALVAGTDYTALGQVARRTLGETIGQSVYDSREYDDATGRLTRQSVALQPTASTTQMDLRYGYDDAGNVTKLDDVASGGPDGQLNQCFNYDYLQRLTEAWSSPSTACAPTGSSALGTTDPYWDQYTYDKSGNRTRWTETRGAGAATTIHHVSTYPAATDLQPHAVQSVTSDGSNPKTQDLTYDLTGNTTANTNPADTTGQHITWDAEGHEADVKDLATDKHTTYIYDADGNRLLKHDDTATEPTTTLYVGASEYTSTTTGPSTNVLSLVRNYSVGDDPVATRDASGLTVIVGDNNHTGQLAIKGTNVDKRRFTAFGTDLDDPATGWPNQHGYLNKTTDASTGTTHLGAREYDPELGRFLSVDSVLDTSNPQQMNGYAYANNSPITMTDPTGLQTESFIPSAKASPSMIASWRMWQVVKAISMLFYHGPTKAEIHAQEQAEAGRAAKKQGGGLLDKVGHAVETVGDKTGDAVKKTGKFVYDNRTTIGLATCIVGPESVACDASVISLVAVDTARGGYSAQRDGKSLGGIVRAAGISGGESAVWAVGGKVIGRGLESAFAAQYGENFLKSGKGGFSGAPPSFAFHAVNLPITGMLSILQYEFEHRND